MYCLLPSVVIGNESVDEFSILLKWISGCRLTRSTKYPTLTQGTGKELVCDCFPYLESSD